MFALVWMAVLPLSLMSAHVGVLLWVWVALLSPTDLLTGFMAGVPFNKIVAVSTFVLMLVSRDRKDAYLDRTMTILLLLALTATISWSTGLVSSEDGDGLYQKLIKEIVLAFTISAVMVSRQRLHLLVLTVVVALGFLGVKEGLISILTVGNHTIIGSGSIGDNNALATALLMIIPLTWYLARYSAVRIVRVGLMATLGLSVITVIMTFSRGGFVGLVILGLFSIGSSHKKLPSLLVVAAVCVLVALFAPPEWFARLSTIQDAGSDDSFMGRVIAWKVSWLLAMDHPLFGGGPHAIQHAAVWGQYLPQIGTLDFVATPKPDGFPHAAHSIYFEMIGDLGFIGFALFMALLGVAFLNCRRIIRLARANPSMRWAGDLARMSQISLVMYMVTGAALSMGYFELIYVVVALLSRCRRTLVQQLAVAEAPRTELWDSSTAEVAIQAE